MKLKMLRCLRHSKTHPDDLKASSKEVERKCSDMQKNFREAVKILLLGTAESGKTTIIKQMRILHINGFSDDERRDKIPEIYQNIHESIYQLVQHMSILGLEYQSCASKHSAAYILTMGETAPEYMNEEYCDHVMTLWNDVGIRTCFERSNEFPLSDSTKYFLDNFERISDFHYIPSTEDILHSRKITTGIHNISFRVEIPKHMGGGEQIFHMYDVGGQRDQRNKWIQVFEGIQAVLFLISCSDFDQTLREDPTQNRLQEALNLFRGVWQNRFLASAGLIVFLNKQDIMERKIRAGKHIVDYFPEFEQFRNSPQAESYFDECDWTKKFIKQKLIDITQEPVKRPSRNHMHNSKRECYYHFTVATDTSCIRKVFNDVHQMILHENMASMDLY
ncbi:Guanine nucleotide-binding protein G(f) subunit alpha [Lucilia cuprina]|uniref:Guanine nucleotide-binding protein G(F) subunit alpha n=1 Tax=Lucilia cuprina TaxID=7375 RepID=A0A0L0CAB9_LUCCU|nr:guanine nucleotide-binding protein G(f) subunit alpha isoform X1 [Lucilia cuprina]KNC29201.1 Guanine nucleotide-binding protein G(f) subunit alpha [Lucilia cuprina]